MRKVMLGMLLITAAAGQTRPEEEIKAVLLRQQRDWNRGDVQAFLQGYEQSETTTFVGTTITRGYSQVLERYRRRYPTRDSMGTLIFSNIEVKMLDADYASALGHWHLARGSQAGGPIGGYFTLLFRRTTGGWKIFLDHTSAE